MLGRGAALAVLLGTGWVHSWSELWSDSVQIMALVVSLVLLVVAYILPVSYWRYGLLCTVAFMIALANTNWQAQSVLAQQLSVTEQNKPFKLRVQIESLPRLRPESRSFRVKVLGATPAYVPEIISLTWSSKEWVGPYAESKAYDFPTIKPGQIWQLTAFLKTPHGARNPFGFDYESYVFAQGVRAVGTIRGTPELISDNPQDWSIGLIAEMWRYQLRQAMLPHIESLRWGGVLLALSIGDQASISAGHCH